ncbi:MAG: hypothetical protein EOO90_20525 [Pedobacter sp.]|nr:MAG: hypothetical protein EOO90_20525 [Pedobacter sp.]
MRIGALLLGLFVLFLSVKSIVAHSSILAEVDTCCKEESNHQDDQNSDTEDCNDLCSPFQSCCPYITAPLAKIGLSSPKTIPLMEESFTLRDISFHSNYASDFWQPPKAV